MRLSDLWNSNKRANIHIFRVQEVEEKKRMSWMNMQRNNGWKHLKFNMWVQEAEWTPNRIGWKKSMQFIIEYVKTKNKKQREGAHYYSRTQFEWQQISLQKLWGLAGGGITFFKCWKKKLLIESFGVQTSLQE